MEEPEDSSLELEDSLQKGEESSSRLEDSSLERLGIESEGDDFKDSSSLVTEGNASQEPSKNAPRTKRQGNFPVNCIFIAR